MQAPTTPAAAALQAALCADAWFGSCAPALQDAVLRLGRAGHLAAGERLFTRGAAAEGLCCVTAGALMLGVSRQSANKALRALEDKGVLKLRYGAIELMDVAALARAAGLA